MLTFPSTSTLISLLFINGLFYQLSSSLPIGRQHGAAALLSWRNYDDLQISGGIGGTALEEAARILQDPFQYTPYEDVEYSIYQHLLNMWEAIEYASIVTFPLALDAAQSQGNDPLAEALSVGKAKNDVLMQAAEVQIYQIRKAKSRNQGQDEEDSEDEDELELYQHDLMVAVAGDRQNSGRASQPVHLDYPL